MENNTDTLIRDMKAFGIVLSELQLSQLMKYYELLSEWNQKINLTAITEFDDVMKKHFVDSASLVKICDINSFESLIDVGTGAGFPGLVLKILFPDLKVTLLDSLNKRIRFLNVVIEELHLAGQRILQNREKEEKNLIYVCPELWQIFLLYRNIVYPL